ncbi:hypothetical protein [Gilvimarinus xylanilyticus]|uniref:Uncharacterized protein n=1 Tax=Gilvimarinus xylanilyticus TaxID=2944139 RepID=A0A9X2KTJ7_9GAMM|nr:hypothetical protein [Gilvimarinus xylanilyticus]MCP8899262.1 hypothetical protein [Gilvimarinus xylanilyticus]
MKRYHFEVVQITRTPVSELADDKHEAELSIRYGLGDFGQPTTESTIQFVKAVEDEKNAVS